MQVSVHLPWTRAHKDGPARGHRPGPGPRDSPELGRSSCCSRSPAISPAWRVAGKRVLLLFTRPCTPVPALPSFPSQEAVPGPTQPPKSKCEPPSPPRPNGQLRALCSARNPSCRLHLCPVSPGPPCAPGSGAVPAPLPQFSTEQPEPSHRCQQLAPAPAGNPLTSSPRNQSVQVAPAACRAVALLPGQGTRAQERPEWVTGLLRRPHGLCLCPAALGKAVPSAQYGSPCGRGTGRPIWSLRVGHLHCRGTRCHRFPRGT